MTSIAAAAFLSPPPSLLAFAISPPAPVRLSLSLYTTTTATTFFTTRKRQNYCISSSSSSSSSSASRYSTKPPAPLSFDLLSASCYLPHPDKEATGGEDAHFISLPRQSIGVADGVGGWAEVGVDAGLYARELMSHSLSAICNNEGFIDPATVLHIAHSKTTAKGSSTACILTLANDQLHAVNLGDSGFILVRDASTVFQSPVQLHSFNFPFQLQSIPGGDLPTSAQLFTIPVALGDVIVVGTDGLFDNLYNNEVTRAVIDALNSGLGHQEAAQSIAALARQRALDKNRNSPFSTAAQDAGYRYYGGKLDDITVVVSYVTTSATGTI